jgi:hypothetical protein
MLATRRRPAGSSRPRHPPWCVATTARTAPTREITCTYTCRRALRERPWNSAEPRLNRGTNIRTERRAPVAAWRDDERRKGLFSGRTQPTCRPHTAQAEQVDDTDTLGEQWNRRTGQGRRRREQMDAGGQKQPSAAAEPEWKGCHRDARENNLCALATRGKNYACCQASSNAERLSEASIYDCLQLYQPQPYIYCTRTCERCQEVGSCPNAVVQRAGSSDTTRVIVALSCHPKLLEFSVATHPLLGYHISPPSCPPP